MAIPIRPLEGRTVHQIQSGQVIVDLCSVVKELVENSLDAGGVSIEVRFKNNGLDTIEVQDNGNGIASDNFENVALKHYTSKLASYDDLASLETFGFRGEALSSLCALSNLHIITAQAGQAPKGTRLKYETSGKLKKMTVTASQKGTTVFVEDLFLNLPVRRKELEKNIKREYGKVLNLLQAYACISTNARIVVTNVPAKGKRVVAFATKSNSSTRENIANVFGVKALHTLATMDLQLQLKSTNTLSTGTENTRVRILGHVSRPVVGEGRNASDRQMFFVNGRPCNLPQVAKVFNEVYKSYNVSQTPFIFADIALNTNAYDVNVSPDKRTILLHDQNSLLESLRDSLVDLFEEQDQKMPQMKKSVTKLPPFKKLSVKQGPAKDVDFTASDEEFILEESEGINNQMNDEDHSSYLLAQSPQSANPSIADSPKIIVNSAGLHTEQHAPKVSSNDDFSHEMRVPSNADGESVQDEKRPQSPTQQPDTPVDPHHLTQFNLAGFQEGARPVDDFNERLHEQQVYANSATSLATRKDPDNSGRESITESSRIPPPFSPGVILNAFESMRPRRQLSQLATVTIGSKTRSTKLGNSSHPRFLTDLHSSASSIEESLSQSERSNEDFSQPPQILLASRGRSEHTFNSQPVCPSVEDEDGSSGESPIHSHFREGEGNISEQALASEEQLESRKGLSQSDTAYSEETIDDDEGKKVREDAKVAELIKRAEEVDVGPNFDKKRRSFQMLRGSKERDSTTALIQALNVSNKRVDQEANALLSTISTSDWHSSSRLAQTALQQADSFDEQITLTISKHDFHNMHVIGQFNLGFILATRNGADLLIVDQHASDEKYNFERLQKTTIVQNQRLVQPRGLALTAFDEEVILENADALLKNGFQVEIDESGSKPVGQRCKLLSLPMSKEVTFNLSDLEELIALLAESSPADFSDHVPRPSKVRRMFAMRACRSSIMIGKTLTLTQMQMLLRHMGEIDRPWNCPHGRPTMRHICGLSDWIGWKEGSGVKGLEEEQVDPVAWASWVDDAGRTKSGMLTNAHGTTVVASTEDEV